MVVLERSFCNEIGSEMGNGFCADAARRLDALWLFLNGELAKTENMLEKDNGVGMFWKLMVEAMRIEIIRSSLAF